MKTGVSKCVEWYLSIQHRLSIQKCYYFYWRFLSLPTIIVSWHCSDVFRCKLNFVLDLPVSSEELMFEVEIWGLDAESGWGWRIQASQTYLIAWITFLSWVTVLGLLHAFMWMLAIRSSGKAPILVDINDWPFRNSPTIRDLEANYGVFRKVQYL